MPRSYTKPPAPVDAGYRFAGWDVDADGQPYARFTDGGSALCLSRETVEADIAQIEGSARDIRTSTIARLAAYREALAALD